MGRSSLNPEIGFRVPLSTGDIPAIRFNQRESDGKISVLATDGSDYGSGCVKKGMISNE